jgi:transposase-like protein
MWFFCPVCGFPDLSNPPRYSSGGASYEICPSCGYQFGYHDNDQGISYEKWRNKWIEEGMTWSSLGIPKPMNWNPGKQLSDFLKSEGE